MSLESNEKTTHPRRDFLKYSALATLALGLPRPGSSFIQNLAQEDLMNFSPIQLLSEGALMSKDFNGDNIDRPHDILWNVDGYLAKKGGIPSPSQKRKVVVIGGGMSGLISAYKLKEFNPLVLEQDKHFGGNSKGESLGGATYSIGAAYVVAPDKDSDIDHFFSELGLYDLMKQEHAEEMGFTYKQTLLKNFWSGASDPARANEFKIVDDEMRRIYNYAYPDIPWTPESAISYEEYLALDSISFDQWLKNTFGNVHPHILEYFQLYCWSSFTASIEEISALQGLNFISAEVEGILALPGGNAAIAHKLCEKIIASTSPNSLRAGAFVLNIEVKANKLVWITYEDSAGKVITVEADTCIVSTPKYVAKRVIPQMPDDQKKAMEKIMFRGYIVANAFYSGSFTSPGFDVYCLEGKYPEPPAAMKPPKRAFSDVCFGTWAQNDKTKYGVMSIYKAIPYDGGRQFLFSPFAHDKNKKAVIEGLKDFEKTVGVNSSQFVGIRMTRWGHSIPVAQKNFIASGMPELINRPINGRVFFANQDNYANPAFETSFFSAELAAQSVRAIIG